MADLIEHINKLQQILSKAGVNIPLKLPEIVVVGDQSSGKSSVLQSIVSREILPRGSLMVTRCPIRICMHHITSGDSYATFSHIFEKSFSLDEVSKIIEERNLQLAGNSISSTEIVVDLYGQNMTSLTLVDLPGIIKVRSDDQSDDIVEKIEELAMERITSKSALILAISAANNDLANSGGLAIARRVDPKGERTIGVITKMDRAENPQNFVDQKKLNLSIKLGYVGVRCRSQEEIDKGETIQQQLIKEKEFFKNSIYFKDVCENFGIETLRKKIDNEFRRHISELLPKIAEDIKTNLAEANAELFDLGSPPAEIKDPALYSHRFIDSVFGKAQEMLAGTILNFKADGIMVGGYTFREEIIKFHEIMSGHKELAFYPVKKINSIIRYSSGLEGIWVIPEKLVKNILEENLNSLRKDINKFLSKISACFSKFLDELSKNCFPNYPNMKILFNKKYAEVMKTTYKKLEEKIEFLIFLEVDCIDPDITPIENFKAEESFIKSIISNIYTKARESLENNIVKYAKHYFIKANFRKLEEAIHLHIDTAWDLEVLFEEDTKVANRRKFVMSKKLTYQELNEYLRQSSDIFYIINE